MRIDTGCEVTPHKTPPFSLVNYKWVRPRKPAVLLFVAFTWNSSLLHYTFAAAKYQSEQQSEQVEEETPDDGEVSNWRRRAGGFEIKGFSCGNIWPRGLNWFGNTSWRAHCHWATNFMKQVYLNFLLTFN